MDQSREAKLMNWISFCLLWLLMSLVAVMFRQRMVYQERNAGYRLSLLVAFLPIGLIINLCVGIGGAFVNYWRFAVDSYRGVEPGASAKLWGQQKPEVEKTDGRVNKPQELEKLSMESEFEKEQAQKVLALFVSTLIFSFHDDIEAPSAIRTGKHFAEAADAEGIGLDQIFGESNK